MLKVADATPKYFLSTDPMMAWVLGAENIPIPIPITAKPAIITYKLVFSVKNAMIKRPILIMAIPSDANLPGSNLSDSLPAKGEMTTMKKV